jgi:hypothetical protein
LPWGTSNFKVSNREIQYLNYSKESKNQMGTGFDSENGEPLQVRWNWRFRNNLYASIPKSMGFFNQY